jgi:quinol monooxygenase YgiN
MERIEHQFRVGPSGCILAANPMNFAHRFNTLALLALALFSFTIDTKAQQETAKALYVVTYVDVFPNFASDTAKLLQQFASESRKDPGSVRFEVLRDIERANHFTIVEVWQSRQAYEAHTALAHTKSFREKIQPGLGSPFDERLYYTLQ